MTPNLPFRPWLLATDLDGTLVGDAAGLAGLKAWLQARRPHWRLAYITGRGWESVWELIRQEGLPLPDALVTDVGTEIHLARGPAAPRGPAGYARDRDWARQLAREWPGARVERAVAGISGLTPQPGVRAALRRSYHVRDGGVVERVRQALRAHRLPVRTVYSSGRDLDLLPASAGKGAALLHLARRLQVPLWRVLACGDSGNDLDMLQLGIAGVVVGNAQPELAAAPLPASVYRAGRACAGGILEGLQRWVSAS